MRKRIRDVWLSLSLKKKIGTFICMLILIITATIIFDYMIVDYTVNGFSIIMTDNVLCNAYQEAVRSERAAFEEYMRSKNEESRMELEVAAVRSERCVRQLPFAYNSVGRERYAQTWRIRNAYSEYARQRDRVLELEEGREGYIEAVYGIYDMQNYLESYSDTLMEMTLKQGTEDYQLQADFFKRIPVYFALMAMVITGGMIYLSRTMLNTIVGPVEQMAVISRHIAVNNYEDADVSVSNRDEIGALAKAFNKMKHATVDYINTLEDRQRVMELLHKEEVDRVEMEKNLNQTRLDLVQTKLDLLRSQVHPHFLFNTLNTIACSARLEEAETTEKMITALSGLFRYNLKMSETMAPLGRELKVVHDYMYIQKMRFGPRIGYEVRCEISEEDVRIPSFTLQPLVENAMIHGLGHKEAGGIICIRVRDAGDCVSICVADTGQGMSRERLRELRGLMAQNATARIGIGLGNIYRRIHMMYQAGEMRLYSKEGAGTVVALRIPKEENKGEEHV